MIRAAQRLSQDAQPQRNSRFSRREVRDSHATPFAPITLQAKRISPPRKVLGQTQGGPARSRSGGNRSGRRQQLAPQRDTPPPPHETFAESVNAYITATPRTAAPRSTSQPRPTPAGKHRGSSTRRPTQRRSASMETGGGAPMVRTLSADYQRPSYNALPLPRRSVSPNTTLPPGKQNEAPQSQIQIRQNPKTPKGKGSLKARCESISRASNEGFEAVEQAVRSPPQAKIPPVLPAGKRTVRRGGVTSPTSGRMDQPRCKPSLPLPGTPEQSLRFSHAYAEESNHTLEQISPITGMVLSPPSQQGEVGKAVPSFSPEQVSPPADLSSFLRQFETTERERERVLRRDIIVTQHQLLREVEERGVGGGGGGVSRQARTPSSPQPIGMPLSTQKSPSVVEYFPIKTSARAAAILERLKKRDTATTPEVPKIVPETDLLNTVTPPRQVSQIRASLISPEVLGQYGSIAEVLGSPVMKEATKETDSEANTEESTEHNNNAAGTKALVADFKRRSEEIRRRMAASLETLNDPLDELEDGSVDVPESAVEVHSSPTAAARIALNEEEPLRVDPSLVSEDARFAKPHTARITRQPRAATANAVKTKAASGRGEPAQRTPSPTPIPPPVVVLDRETRERRRTVSPPPAFPDRPGSVSAEVHRKIAADPDPSKPLPAHKDPRAWQAGISKTFKRGAKRQHSTEPHPGGAAATPQDTASFRIAGLFSDTITPVPTTRHHPQQPHPTPPAPPSTEEPPVGGVTQKTALRIQRCWRRAKWLRVLQDRCRSRAASREWRIVLRVQTAARGFLARRRYQRIIRERRELESVMLDLTQSIRDTAFKKQMKRRTLRRKQRKDEVAILTRELPRMYTELRSKREEHEKIDQEGYNKLAARRLEVQIQELESQIRLNDAEVQRLTDDEIFEREMEEEELRDDTGTLDTWKTLTHKDRDYLQHFLDSTPLAQTPHFKTMFKGLFLAVETGDARLAMPSMSPRNNHFRHIKDYNRRKTDQPIDLQTTEPVGASSVSMQQQHRPPPRTSPSPRSSPRSSPRLTPRGATSASHSCLRRSPSASMASMRSGLSSPGGAVSVSGIARRGVRGSASPKKKKWEASLTNVMGTVEEAFSAAAELTEDWQGSDAMLDEPSQVLTHALQSAEWKGGKGREEKEVDLGDIMERSAERVVEREEEEEEGDVTERCAEESETVSECYRAAMLEVQECVSPPAALLHGRGGAAREPPSPVLATPHQLIPNVAKSALLMAAALSVHLTHHYPEGNEVLAQFAPSELARAFAPSMRETVMQSDLTHLQE